MKTKDVTHPLAPLMPHRLLFGIFSLFVWMCASAAQAQIVDNFDDGNLGTNTTGTGTGFSSIGQLSVSEGSGVVNMTGSSYSTMVIESNDTVNPFQATSTTTHFRFGSIAYAPAYQRFWLGYKDSAFSEDHFFPEQPSRAQGLYVSVISNTGFENAYNYTGNLVSQNGSIRTILASWTWSDVTQLSNLTVSLTTTATTYSISFSGAVATPTFNVGASSGALTGLGSTSGKTFRVGVHNQSNGTSTAVVDAIIMGALPASAPTLASVSPSSGSTAGGTSVTLTGTGFTGTPAVTFGGVAATSVVVVNSTTITAVTPAGSAGTASVLVTTPGGTNAANALFTYDDASIYGNAVLFDSVSGHSPGNLLGNQITVTARGPLESFGLIMASASPSNASVGLYTDVAGAPNTLVAQTGSFNISAGGRVEAAPTAPVTLNPGTYWIMAVFDGTPIIGHSSTIQAPTALRSLAFTGSLPTNFGSAITYTDSAANYYIKVGIPPNTAPTITSRADGSSALSSVLTRLDTHQANLRALVPSSYAFVDGITGDNIVDGGDDMYDSGNYLNTPLGSSIPYSDGVVTPNGVLGVGGRYFTRKHTGFFTFVADLNGVSSFFTSGNLGADGNGLTSSAVLTRTVGGVTYKGFLKRVYGTADPSVNQLIIVQDRPGLSQTAATNTDDNLHTVNGLGGTTRLYYLLFASSAGGFVSDAVYGNIMDYFLQNVVTDSLTRDAGFAAASVPVATVSDAETAAGSLTVTATTVPAGINVTGITNSAGTISAFVTADSTTASGQYTVVLTVSDGSLTANANLGVRVVALTRVDSISPTSGSTAGGTAVTITGAGFTGTPTVTFGGVAATSVVVVNSTTITAVTPAGSAGTASVLVTTPSGTNAANTLFTYDAPATYGYDVLLNTSSGHSSGYLLGYRITVTAPGPLSSFGLIMATAVPSNASIGLYTDVAGAPDTLVAQTGSFNINTGGRVEAPPTAPVRLSPGNYWIMAVFDGTPQIGHSSSIAATTVFRSLAFTGSLPTTFGPASSYSGTAANYYIRVGSAANSAPTITSNGGGATASINVAENSTAVTTVTATDTDTPAQTLTYTKSGADATFFTLNPTSGALSFTSAPNFEAPADSGLNNIYDVTVTVTDSGAPGLTDTQAISVIVTDVNEGPAIKPSSSYLAYETVNPTRDGAGLIVYTTNNAATLAALPFNRVRYRMENTTGGVAYFADASFDAWSGLTVDGLKVPDAGNIVTTQRNVTNVSIRSNHPRVINSNTELGRLEHWTNNYSPPGIIGGSATLFDYDDTPHTPIVGYGSFQLHNLSATLPETVFAWNNHAAGVIPDVGFGNSTIGIHPDWTFTNTGTNAWRMQIYIENHFVPPTMSFTEDVTGNILFFNSPFLDDSASLTVTLSIADGTVTGNAGTGITVGGTATSRIFSGSVADLNAYFTTPGKVTYLGALNNTVSRTLTVTVSDGSLSTNTTSTLHLAPVNDVPTDIAVTPSNVPENNEPNAIVGTLSTTDPDVGDTFTYSLVTGAGNTDNGSFSIVGNTLRITPGVDFETKPSYSIRVRSIEASTAFIEKALTINVRDLLEQEIAYDDFRRPSDSGTGWSTNWSVANPAVANLVYSPLNSGGNAAGSGAGQRFRTLSAAQTTGVVYVSALLKGGGYCNVTLYDSSQEKVSFGVVYDPVLGTFNPNFGLFDETRRFEGGAAMVPSAVAVNTATHLILARVDLDLNTVDRWLDPNLAMPLGAPNCTSRAGAASGGNYDFNRVRLEVTGTAVMDEVRVMSGDRRFVADRVTSASIASPSVTNVKNTRATLGGNISQTGGSAILERGVVYAATAVNSNPEVGGAGVFQAVASGTSTGAFTVGVTGLAAGTNYSFKAYVRNAIGTTYTLTTGTFQTLSIPEPIPGDSGDVISNSLATGADGTSTIGNYGVLRRGGFLADSGVLAYPGYLMIGSGSPAVTTANHSGIWKVVGGNPLLVARTGTTVPDVPGAWFATLPEVPGLSESGDVSLLASLVVGSSGVTTANDMGAWSEIGGGGLRLLLREDDNIPSLAGVKVGSFASGIYATARTGASTGEAVFSVTYKGASTKTALLRTSVSGATTTVSVVAQEGELAPGTSPAANYVSVAGSYSDPGRMDAQGNFVYAALTTPGNKEGIWYQPVTGGTPNKVFFAGETAPGTGGATFARLQRPSMGSNGFISFRATLNRDGDNAANARNDGIWNGSASNPASFTCVLRRGDGVAKVSNLPVGSLVGNPWGGWLTNSNLGAWRAWLDVDGDGISSTADGDVNAIFANLSGAMQLAVKVGDAAPGTTGATFSGFDLPMVGGNNQYAIMGNLTGGDTVTANNQGLWKSGPNGGALTLVMRKGATITTTEGSKTVTKIDVPGSNQTDRRWEQPVMDSAGRMVVYVTFSDGSTSQVIVP